MLMSILCKCRMSIATIVRSISNVDDNQRQQCKTSTHCFWTGQKRYQLDWKESHRAKLIHVCKYVMYTPSDPNIDYMFYVPQFSMSFKYLELAFLKRKKVNSCHCFQMFKPARSLHYVSKRVYNRLSHVLCRAYNFQRLSTGVLHARSWNQKLISKDQHRSRVIGTLKQRD